MRCDRHTLTPPPLRHPSKCETRAAENWIDNILAFPAFWDTDISMAAVSRK
jgi:hypothetical protein